MHDGKPCHDPTITGSGRQGNESIPQQRWYNRNDVKPVALQPLQTRRPISTCGRGFKRYERDQRDAS